MKKLKEIQKELIKFNITQKELIALTDALQAIYLKGFEEGLAYALKSHKKALKK